VDERAVADLEQLARRDSALSDEAERVRELDAQVAAVRARAEAIDAFFVAYPEEERRRRAATRAAEEERARRLAELAETERLLAAAREEEARERGASAVARARDHVAVADSALERARAAAAELERDAASLPEELPLLDERARAVASSFEHVPAPPGGVRDLVAWASRAHAELFVAAGQIAAQRERVIREANELASMLLGEPTYGSTVEQALARVTRVS
jgi:chromosome segregation ATPase